MLFVFLLSAGGLVLVRCVFYFGDSDFGVGFLLCTEYWESLYRYPKYTEC